MLTVAEARKIGIKACMDKIGYDFCMSNKDNATTGYTEEEGFVYCYVGVSDKSPDTLQAGLLFTATKFPFSASCNVRLVDGKIDFLECHLPM